MVSEPTAETRPGFDGRSKPELPLDPAALYGFGHLIRGSEETLLDLFSKGQLSGTTHTCLGQELCQMGVVRALNHDRDAIFSNHRNHGHFLTYSGDFAGLFAEIMGREAGVCGGHGGSQHLAYRGFHSSGVQGGMTAIAVGEALARKQDGAGGIVAVIIGDGTLGQGLVYESLNLAGVWDVPVLFVVENNSIAQTTPTDMTTAGSLTARGEAFGIQTWRVSDDAPDFFERAEAAVDAVRKTGSPGFLVIDTMRLGPHSKGDDLRGSEEMDAIRARDPLTRLGERLPDAERQAIEKSNADFLKAAVDEAMQSPPAQFDEVPLHPFGPNQPVQAKTVQVGGTVRQALNAALHRMLEQSPEVILLGEDLHDPYGGAFKVSERLTTAYPDRVLSTPISEAGIVGAGIGLAMAGKRPIVEIMFADFLSLGMDQIYNHAVKFPPLFDEVTVPLVIRAACGGGRGYGATHSQTPESLCASVPGLTVIYGSHRHDAGGLLENAVLNWDHPTVFFEHKLLYSRPNEPDGYKALAAHASDPAAGLFPTLQNGRDEPDITIIAYGGMAPLVEVVAEELEREEELSVEIILPSLIAPLPRNTLIAALSDRPRIVLAEESPTEFGVGAEIAASLAEAGFDGHILRVGPPPVPIPSARSLEEQVLPDRDRLIAEILEMF
ncbi:alpha-ketoacid dehydrogenase subunit alpha/beta [Hoeflea poritis]|uniref:2-oxoglutarate dehydrogenase E1 component n=1 Tax=Hoeflea poritis TaxID=2993659 RepID=A0ABT4VPE2_9HYPH|nr:alpha-ketoacid dehydrogenase subunit alpha/beta [Hoeflea poritis]MDA4846582.1 thiamine pyrophosphate-dependent enzyme [Hoeflea poritis]